MFQKKKKKNQKLKFKWLRSWKGLTYMLRMNFFMLELLSYTQWKWFETRCRNKHRWGGTKRGRNEKGQEKVSFFSSKRKNFGETK
jgi:hypothetical protein